MIAFKVMQPKQMLGVNLDRSRWSRLRCSAALLFQSHQEEFEDHSGGQSHQAGAWWVPHEGQVPGQLRSACRDKSLDSSEGAERRGWDGKLLAVDFEEGKRLRANMTLTATRGGGGETSYMTAPQPGDVLVQGVKHKWKAASSWRLCSCPYWNQRRCDRLQVGVTPDLCNNLQRKTTYCL